MTKHLPAEHTSTALQHLVSADAAAARRPGAVPALPAMLVAGFVVVTLYVLSLRTLVPPDEGRYAEMAREMVAGGDWITTRLNGIKYFEKPPLQTWMNALTFAAFGLGEWQARLWTGLCAIFGVLMTGYTGARVFDARTGRYTALVLGSCLYWVAGGQVDSLDMGLSGTMTLALCALLLAQRPGIPARARRDWMLACWTGMALAVLSKGLVGIVLPGAALAAYALAARDAGIWKRLHIARGLPLFLLLAAPWFVLVGLRNPEQPHFFFIHEHVERFLLKEHHREAPWWYFLALLAAGSIPWLGMLAHGLAAGARRDPADGAGPGAFRPRLLALAWVVVIVAFFSASSSKLPGYILPVFPALALLLGRHAGEAPRRILAANALLAGAAGLALLAAAACAGSFARIPAEAAAYRAWTPWIAAAGLAMLGGAGAALWCLRRGRVQAQVVAIAAGGFLAGQLLLAGFGPVAALRTGAELLPAIRAALTPATHLYSVGLYEQSLTFYLGRTATLVDYEDEFAFGLAQQPALAIPTLDAFAERWTREARAGIPGLAIVRPELVAKLRARGVLLRVVAADARRSVIATP